MQNRNKVLLVVMDGWGVGMRWGGNAVYKAHPSFYADLWRTVPATTLGAAGAEVGLLPQYAGNSEAGHLNIGAGRIVGQDLAWITHQIDTGEFFKNEGLNKIFAAAKQNNKPVHIVGLLSDGGVHAHIDHMYALIELASHYKPVIVYFHIFGDGRDSEPHRIKILMDRLQKRFQKYGVGEIVSIIGRYYAMDRDRNYDRTAKTYDLLVKGSGDAVADLAGGVDVFYKRGLTDEYLPPMTLATETQRSRIKDGDYVIITNYRADRIWQLEASLARPDFEKEVGRPPLKLAEMVSFVPIETAPELKSVMAPPLIKETLGEVISRSSLKQLRLAESEKGAHATYFLNGGIKKPFSGQEDQIVPSPKANYAEVPEMSAAKLLQLAEGAIGKYDFVFLNLANPDMVGHTGNMEAAIKAVRIVDDIVARLAQKAKATGSVMLVTADHGNCDEMIIPYLGEPSTDHSENRVPFFVVGVEGANKLRPGGCLADIAPTVLDVMKLQKPAAMTGRSLLKNSS